MNNNANIVSLGSGFDEFLASQGGAISQQNETLAVMTTPAPILTTNNTAAPTGTSGVDDGLLDFLSGQGPPSAAPTNPATPSQAFPELIPQASVPTTPPEDATFAIFASAQTPTIPISDPSTVQPDATASTAAAAAIPTPVVIDQQQNTAAPANVPTPTEGAPPAAPEVPVIQDPVLREINERFGGRWKMVRSDPYDEYLKSVGVGLVQRKLASRGFPEQVVEIVGDKIHISMHSTFYNQNYVFQLNEETVNLVEKESQGVFCSYKDGKLLLHMTPTAQGFTKVQEVVRSINERQELVVIFSSGPASCRRVFQRMVVVPK